MSQHFAVIRPANRAYRVFFRDELLVETSDVLELEEHFGDKTYPVVCYFAKRATEGLLGETNAHHSHCPIKGQASYFDFRGVDNAIWTYERPVPGVAQIADHIAFDTAKGFRIEAVA
ncbi:MAG: DUF427 domain-containing protein [Myxococcales bacterium]|nr:DUF427 domain-containing protein [Myxococcales bacterium]